MTEAQKERYGAATGIIFIILLIVGFLVVIPKPPDVDSTAQQWATYFADKQDRIQTGVVILSFGLFFFVWFLGSLRSGLAKAEGGSGRLASVAFAGGLVAAAFFVVALTLTAAAAYRPLTTPPEVTRALNDVALMVAGPAAAGFIALFAATALVALRSGSFGSAVGAVCAITAVAQVVAYFTILTDNGTFAPDGAVGLFVPVITFLVGTVTISVALMRQAGAAEAG